MTSAIKSYARRIRQLRLANADVSEPALAPAFQTLIAELLPTLDAIPQLTVVPECQNPVRAVPILRLLRQGRFASTLRNVTRFLIVVTRQDRSPKLGVKCN